MVMATGGSCRRQSAASSPHEGRRSADGGEALALHDRLVAYVHALDNPQDGKSDVWVEHSYALCGRGAGGGPVRVLLGARPDAPDADDVDVEAAPPPPPEPPADEPPDSGAEDDADEGADDEWEARLASLAPHADHARLAAAAVDCLRRVRLAKLAGGRFAERCAVSEQARRLRLALAPLWAGPAGAAQRPAAWLHAALFAVAPPAARRTYERLVCELRRMVPRLVERLTGARPPQQPLATTVDRPPEVSGVSVAYSRYTCLVQINYPRIILRFSLIEQSFASA
ncbi:hypothetical protein ABMA27_004085 [Loxostege sticticalis]|uniref:Uncharacterized protein n=1 Tax=Loxostege sticticalis TaxID=481309 RepID=A0ABR3HRG0_LOXSC